MDGSPTTPLWVNVAVCRPLYGTFTYAWPEQAPKPVAGLRVRVQFAHRQETGIVVDCDVKPDRDVEQIANVLQVLDDEPVFDAKLWALLRWATEYYQQPIGEVLFTALPSVLRKGRPQIPEDMSHWQISAEGLQALEGGDYQRAPVKQALLDHLRQPRSGAGLKGFHPHWRMHLKVLEKAGLVQPVAARPAQRQRRGERHELNAEQQAVVDAVAWDGFTPYLLEGVTGSGKTEVYMALMEQVLALGRQVLVLVPEIGLTPQLLQRLQRGTGWPVTALHSGLSDGERWRAHALARTGQAAVVAGTRSAVFAPFRNLGLIVVDEEHDGSYKQQDGFRYHARDLAVMRARGLNIPVVLGSATPSLESLWNARRGRYRHLRLRRRATGAVMPNIHLLDLRLDRGEDGLTRALRQRVEAVLGRGGQVLLFINQRGYAPVRFCAQCGWQAHCPDCDRPMSVHLKAGWLRCHFCHRQQPLMQACPDCGHDTLVDVGAGTQRVAQAIERAFPHVPVIRVDRDSVGSGAEFDGLLAPLRAGRPCVLVGTQMLAKGHDYPGIELVGVLQTDQGLFSLDFRAQEHLAQLLLQVSGRAGRGRAVGEVLIQTWMPEHAFFRTLFGEGYGALVERWLAEREVMGLPPVGHLALLRVEARDASVCQAFLQQLCQALAKDERAWVRGPLPSLMQRKAGYHRYLLVVQTPRRDLRQQCVSALIRQASRQKRRKGLRWWVDVDPQEPF